MTISTFANQHQQNVNWGHVAVRRAYRERKRIEAQDRQARFDSEVAKVQREQNCGPRDARYVVNARRRHERRVGSR